MGNTVGRSVRLFLVDGNPSGLITAEIMNWTGHLLLVPRSRLADALEREESRRTGIYFLIGSDPNDTFKRLVYIGEGDNVGERIKSHSKDEGKDFWETVCIVTSKDANLTKSHVRYLEVRMLEMARLSGRASLSNGNTPGPKLLPEADVSDMEFFAEQVQVVLPVLGQDFLKPQLGRTDVPVAKEEARAEGVPDSLVEIELDNRAGVHAEGVLSGEEIIVFSGSTATTREYTSNSYAALRNSLIREGTLQGGSADYLTFARNVAFTSPSAASSVILNRNDNGRTTWRVKNTNLSLKEWEEQKIAQVAQRIKDLW